MKIYFAPQAKKDLSKLDKTIQRQIVSKLDEVKKSPMPDRYLSPLKEIDAYRIRVGDHRIIVDRTKDCLYVLAIGHRKSIYR
jgi:mRNA interferase RelE/StbE